MIYNSRNSLTFSNIVLQISVMDSTCSFFIRCFCIWVIADIIIFLTTEIPSDNVIIKDISVITFGINIGNIPFRNDLTIIERNMKFFIISLDKLVVYW